MQLLYLFWVADIHNLSNVIRLHRNQVPISGIDYSLNEVTDVVISMADGMYFIWVSHDYMETLYKNDFS